MGVATPLVLKKSCGKDTNFQYISTNHIIHISHLLKLQYSLQLSCVPFCVQNAYVFRNYMPMKAPILH